MHTSGTAPSRTGTEADEPRWIDSRTDHDGRWTGGAHPSSGSAFACAGRHRSAVMRGRTHGVGAAHIRQAELSCLGNTDGGWYRHDRALPVDSSPDLYGGGSIRVGVRPGAHVGIRRWHGRSRYGGRSVTNVGGRIASPPVVSRVRGVCAYNEADGALRVLAR